jgi:hypothetical protein
MYWLGLYPLCQMENRGTLGYVMPSYMGLAPPISLRTPFGDSVARIRLCGRNGEGPEASKAIPPIM